MQTREAAFDYWLHERGYRYIGPCSIYKLTVPEMARLYQGWRYVEEKRAEHTRQQAGGGAGSAVGANPHRQKPRVRESDRRAARKFAQQNTV